MHLAEIRAQKLIAILKECEKNNSELSMESIEEKLQNKANEACSIIHNIFHVL